MKTETCEHQWIKIQEPTLFPQPLRRYKHCLKCGTEEEGWEA